MSDWGGPTTRARPALYGLDLEMGTNKPYEEYYLAGPSGSSWRAAPCLSVLDDKVRVAPGDVPDQGLRRPPAGVGEHEGAPRRPGRSPRRRSSS